MFSANAVAADVRPVSHDDVWLMQRLGTPVVSPNGQYAIVDVTEPSYEKDAAVSDLWLIDIDGRQQPRRLTATTEGESAVDWSPDGRRIAFSTKRGDDEVNQIYVLNMDGPGEAVRLTSVSTGADTPKWSPDGRRIAFESRVYPGAVDDAANAAEKEAREERKVNVRNLPDSPVGSLARRFADTPVRTGRTAGGCRTRSARRHGPGKGSGFRWGRIKVGRFTVRGVDPGWVRTGLQRDGEPR
jgi:dipeptidyl aminopeptidase/acylaminoacyl peptidase